MWADVDYPKPDLTSCIVTGEEQGNFLISNAASLKSEIWQGEKIFVEKQSASSDLITSAQTTARPRTLDI